VDGPDAAGGGLNLGAAVNTITKSGTNDLHGSLYGFARNNDVYANNLLSEPGFNTLRFDQCGATVGGPARRDKMFYFGGLRRATPCAIFYLFPLRSRPNRQFKATNTTVFQFC
jgi:hypothetical protein